MTKHDLRAETHVRLQARDSARSKAQLAAKLFGTPRYSIALREDLERALADLHQAEAELDIAVVKERAAGR